MKRRLIKKEFIFTGRRYKKIKIGLSLRDWARNWRQECRRLGWTDAAECYKLEEIKKFSERSKNIIKRFGDEQERNQVL